MNTLSDLLRNALLEKRLLPKDKTRATRTRRWLENMGCRMNPWNTNPTDFMAVEIKCRPCKYLARGGVWKRTTDSITVEVPKDLALKILALGYLPKN